MASPSHCFGVFLTETSTETSTEIPSYRRGDSVATPSLRASKSQSPTPPLARGFLFGKTMRGAAGVADRSVATALRGTQVRRSGACHLFHNPEVQLSEVVI